MPDAGNVSAAPDANELDGVKFRHVEPEVFQESRGNAELRENNDWENGRCQKEPANGETHTRRFKNKPTRPGGVPSFTLQSSGSQ